MLCPELHDRLDIDIPANHYKLKTSVTKSCKLDRLGRISQVVPKCQQPSCSGSRSDVTPIGFLGSSGSVLAPVAPGRYRLTTSSRRQRLFHTQKWILESVLPDEQSSKQASNQFKDQPKPR